MSAFGFQNLPLWHDELQKIISRLGQNQLLEAPVLGLENVEHPWTALEKDDFFHTVETGIIFSGRSKPDKFAKNIVTNDAAVAIYRIKEGHYQNTFFRGAIGGVFPILNIINSSFACNKLNKVIIQNDAIAGFILSKMEKNGKNLEEATREAQWKGLVTDNPNLNLHGVVTKNRFSLQVAEIFGKFIDPDQIDVYGINTLELRDVNIASSMGFSIRLLGIAENIDNNLGICIEACMIPEKYFMAQAKGGSEIIYSCDVNGASQVYACPGTSNETSVRGMLADLYEPISKHSNFAIQEKAMPLIGNFYIRISIDQTKDAIVSIANCFSRNSIDFKSLEYKYDASQTEKKEIVIITEVTDRKNINQLCDCINRDINGVSVEALFRFIK